MTATPADHSFYFNPADDPCPYCDKQMAGALNCPSRIREHPDRPWPQDAIDQEMIERVSDDWECPDYSAPRTSCAHPHCSCPPDARCP